MKPKLQLLLLFCTLALNATAQNDTTAKAGMAQNDTSLKFTDIQKIPQAKVDSVKKEQPFIARYVGDAAPQLRVSGWVKGTPVTGFEKGKVYVIDFWATWCMPCVMAMPHLSQLARRYRGKVAFSAVSVFERRENTGNTPEKLKAFVDHMGDKMDFNVASEDTTATVRDWPDAFGLDYIPVSFVIDGNGRVAWAGSTQKLDTVLSRIVNNTWDIEAESAKKKYNDSVQNYLQVLDESVIDKTREFQKRSGNENLQGFTDSILAVTGQMVKAEPRLKYMPGVAAHTFAALLITDPAGACTFGRDMMAANHSDWLTCNSIISEIRFGLRNLTMPKEVYLLGAECYRVKIDLSPPWYLPADMAEQHRNMADWYRHGGDKLKAIAADKKAIILWERDAKQ